MLVALERAHIENYSIFLRVGYLSGYLEYSGLSLAASLIARDRKLVSGGVAERICGITQ